MTPKCPNCGGLMTFSFVFKVWICNHCGEAYDDFSLADYEADQRAKAAYLDSLDNAVEDDDDYEEDEW